MPAASPEKLKVPSPLLGFIVTCHDPAVTEALSYSGVDFLFFDTEHAPLSLADVNNLIRATGGRCASLVRIANKHDESLVKQALDGGCDGIIVPSVNSAAEAANIVRWAKYSPMGERSVGITRAHTYGLNFKDYIAKANRTTSIIVQIETLAAVDKIEEIMSVSGVDGVFIGPYDLSASMGVLGEVKHPNVLAAIRHVKDAAIKHKLPVGIFVNSHDAAAAQIKDGVKFLALGIDIGIMIQGVRSTLERIKSL